VIGALFFFVLAGMIAAYAVLDGFDLGAGILHRALARNDEERRAVFSAIGPYWDGNEVWLIAVGGVLFAIFPAVLGSALSGMYLAIFLIVWMLLGRGLSIELRGHVDDPLWKSFWDTIFMLSSLGLALIFGVAIGNLVRGFSLDPAGDFELALFDELAPDGATGLIDAYTLASGVYTVLALALQGACFVAWKTDGELGARAQALARRLTIPTALAWAGLLALTWSVRPTLFSSLLARPAALVAVALCSLLAVLGLVTAARAKERLAFLGSSTHLAALLFATAIAAYPTLLFARSGVSQTIWNSAAPARSLSAALVWYPFGLALAVGYAAMLFRLHRGKVERG